MAYLGHVPASGLVNGLQDIGGHLMPHLFRWSCGLEVLLKEEVRLGSPPPQHVSHTVFLFFVFLTLFLHPLSQPSQKQRISEAQRGERACPGSHSKFARAEDRFPGQ